MWDYLFGQPKPAHCKRARRSSCGATRGHILHVRTYAQHTLKMDASSSSPEQAKRGHSPLQMAPSDIICALQDCCRAKEVGYVLGCACKALRPTEKAWERYAKRNPPTRHAVVSCTWSEWCKELRLLREPDMNGHSHAAHTIPITYQFEDGASKISPTPRFVLQIWSGRKCVTTTKLSFEQDVTITHTPHSWAPPGSEYSSSMAAGTLHSHQDDGETCSHCQQMRAGDAITDSIGVRLGLDCKPLRVLIVALPRSKEAQAPRIAPTVVFYVTMRDGARGLSTGCHRDFLAECLGTGTTAATISGNDQLRGPQRGSSAWGLVNHHADLGFYPLGMGRYTDLQAGKPLAACVMRILRDAAGAATELMIEEFNWEF